MTFPEWLKSQKSQKKITSSKVYYDSLGGELVLGIKLRQFQMVEKGDQPPSGKLLTAFLGQTSKTDWHSLISSFVCSQIGDSGLRPEVEEHMISFFAPYFEQSSNEIWSKEKTFATFTDDQLDFLNTNQSAFYAFKNTLLNDGVDRSKLRIDDADLAKMSDLKLIQLTGDKVKPSNLGFTMPNFLISPPRTNRRAYKYILNHFDNFLSWEGSNKQTVRYGLQYIKKSHAEQALVQFGKFRNWLNHFAIRRDPVDDDEIVPFVFVMFGKELELRELS